MERSISRSEAIFALSMRNESPISSLVFALVMSKLAYHSMTSFDTVLLGFPPSESTNPAPHDTDPLSLYTSPWAMFPKASRTLTRTVVFSPAMNILEEGVISIFAGNAGKTVMVSNHLTPFRSKNSKRYTPDFWRRDGSRKRYSFFGTLIGPRMSVPSISSYIRRVYGRFSESTT